MRGVTLMVIAGALLAATSSGCGVGETQEGTKAPSASMVAPATKIPAGTPIQVKLTSTISSETAKRGQGWTGVVAAPVVVGNQAPIAEGSAVYGVVSAVQPAKKGERAMLDLEVRSITSHDKRRSIVAGTEAVVAGSPRARNLGAIAGGAAAGALIGKAVGGDNKDAAIGGIIGGAAAGGAVAASKGYQVVLKEGTTLVFTTEK